MQKLFLPFCFKCTMFFLLALPMGLSAQSTTEAKTAQQQAEALFMQQNPQVQKVDLEKLQAEQKDQHKKCNTCGKKASKTNPSTSSAAQTTLDLKELNTEKERLLQLIQHMQDAGSKDKSLYDKYKRALILNQQQIKVAESRQAAQNKQKSAPKK